MHKGNHLIIFVWLLADLSERAAIVCRPDCQRSVDRTLLWRRSDDVSIVYLTSLSTPVTVGESARCQVKAILQVIVPCTRCAYT